MDTYEGFIEFTESAFVGVGAKVAEEYLHLGEPYFYGNAIPGTTSSLTPNGIGVDDVAFAAGIPALYFVANRKDKKKGAVKALGALTGIVLNKLVQAAGGGVVTIPASVLGFKSGGTGVDVGHSGPPTMIFGRPEWQNPATARVPNLF